MPQRLQRRRAKGYCKPDAAVRFLSVEPMLGPINLHRWLDVVPAGMPRIFPLAHTAGVSTPLLDWVVCGAESGPNRRPFEMKWARNLWRQCEAARVAFFFKQGSGLRPETAPWIEEEDGSRWSIRQFPNDLREPERIEGRGD